MMSRTFIACRTAVFDRGSAPVSFLNELVDWALEAPDEIFAKNERFDIYSSVADQLGPFPTLLQRKAVMLEVLRVLAGFESSWDWTEGVDTTNPSSNTPCTEEAGIFQCSGNAMSFDPSLKKLLKKHSGGKTSCAAFQATSKSDHRFAIEFCARLLRFTVNHHGPVKHRKIHPYLRHDAMTEFQKHLTEDA